eukprot:XP_027312554.1 nocturnin isoform X2 [Anas platyrhynchos]
MAQGVTVVVGGWNWRFGGSFPTPQRAGLSWRPHGCVGALVRGGARRRPACLPRLPAPALYGGAASLSSPVTRVAAPRPADVSAGALRRALGRALPLGGPGGGRKDGCRCRCHVPGPRALPVPAAAPRRHRQHRAATAPRRVPHGGRRQPAVRRAGTDAEQHQRSGTSSSAAAAAAPRERRGQPEAEPEPLEARELLAQCRLVLRRRPPRCRRRFVDLRQGAAGGPRPIRVMQWNILAQALGEGKDNFVQCPMEALKWEERKCLILEEILAYQPDILCLQEVDHYFDTFQPLLSRLGYQGTFFPKPWSPCLDVERNNGPDGCALFFLKDRFELINSANIRLTAMKLKTNQVAIAQTLKCHETGRLFCIAVTHLKARTGWERFRSAQGCDLLQNLKSITQGAKIPLIVCGDFNAEPTEEVYREFSNSSLNLNSAYKLLSPDGQSEPPYTTWKIRPSGECRHTLDYIWYSQHALNVNSALGLLTEEQIGPNRLPSFNYPSDHMSLVCDFSFNQDPDRLL